MQSPDGSWSAVASNLIEILPGGVTVYNFSVTGDHTYFVADANGGVSAVWVHNADGRLYIGRKAPRANGGFGPAHGGQAHNDLLDYLAARLRANGWRDIRKNQWQVDANGYIAGINRPDLSAVHPITNRRYNIEIDTRSSRGHVSVLELNDPDAVNKSIPASAIVNILDLI